MPAGRPTDYKGEETLKKVREYLDSCEDKEYKLIKSDGDKSTTWENKLKVKLPTIEGLALHLKVHRDTIHQWSKDYEAFSDLLEELRQAQADKLLNNGLAGNYSPVITKLVLSKHGYKEEQDITSKGEKILVMPTELLNAHGINPSTKGNSK